MRVPEHFKTTQPYQQGQLKHFMIAIWKGLNGDEEEAAEGLAYIVNEVRRQIAEVRTRTEAKLAAAG